MPTNVHRLCAGDFLTEDTDREARRRLRLEVERNDRRGDREAVLLRDEDRRADAVLELADARAAENDLAAVSRDGADLGRSVEVDEGCRADLLAVDENRTNRRSELHARARAERTVVRCRSFFRVRGATLRDETETDEQQ